MRINEITDEVNRRGQAIAVLAVRVMRRHPPRVRAVIVHKNSSSPAKISNLANEPANLSADDRTGKWIAVSSRLFQDQDRKTALMATLLQIVAENSGRPLTDNSAVRAAKQKIRRNEPGPVIANQRDELLNAKTRFRRC